MILSSRLRVIPCLMLPALLVFACTPAQAPTPTPTAAVALAEITFDGKTCQYQGPEVIRGDKAVIVMNNLTNDQFVHMHVDKLDEGKTWQDYVDYIGPGTSLDAPAWVSEERTGPVEDNPDAQEISLRPGIHVIVCARHAGVVNDIPNGVWLAAPFDVRP